MLNFFIVTVGIFLLNLLVIRPLFFYGARSSVVILIMHKVATFIHETSHVLFNILTLHKIVEFHLYWFDAEKNAFVRPKPIGRDHTGCLAAFLGAFGPLWIGTYLILQIVDRFLTATMLLDKLLLFGALLICLMASVSSKTDLHFFIGALTDNWFDTFRQICFVGISFFGWLLISPDSLIWAAYSPYPLIFLGIVYGGFLIDFFFMLAVRWRM